MSKNQPIQADFTDAKSVPTRGVFRLMFDVPIEQADHVLKCLRGWPQPGSNRVCAIVLMDGENEC